LVLKKKNEWFQTSIEIISLSLMKEREREREV